MRRFPGLRSIRTRLTLWYTGLLLVILLLVGWLSYEVLAWSLLQDVDASLVTVAHVIRDTADAREGGAAAETMLRDLLGPEVYDKFFQFRDREGQPEGRSGFLRGRSLPLSPLARGNARRGIQTLETLVLRGGERVRLLTLPIVREGRLDRLVQVGISLERMEGALRRYLHIILALVPVGVGLAAVGGALIARAALGPVNAMARTARRITAEDLSQRILIRGTGDELDYLAETLNGMLARLTSCARRSPRSRAAPRWRCARPARRRSISACSARASRRWIGSSAWPRICCSSRAPPPPEAGCRARGWRWSPWCWRPWRRGPGSRRVPG
jgi:HAMP domain-containing protein